jgi:type III secretory pathway component EscR
MELTDERIQTIIKQYERKREKEKERYQRIKDTEEFKNKNRANARNHYQNNKEKKKEKYDKNRDFLNARSSYYYYKKLDKIDLFKDKYPEKIKILNDNNLII